MEGKLTPKTVFKITGDFPESLVLMGIKFFANRLILSMKLREDRWDQ